jgi:hypothetical protein
LRVLLNAAGESAVFEKSSKTGSTPVETGLKVRSKGILGFAAGQTFPGTGKGTITGVTPGSGLLGGGTTGTVTLNLDTTKVPLLIGSNNFTAPQDFKANIGIGIGPSGTGYTPLTVGGTATFGTWMAISNTSAGGPYPEYHFGRQRQRGRRAQSRHHRPDRQEHDMAMEIQTPPT